MLGTSMHCMYSCCIIMQIKFICTSININIYIYNDLYETMQSYAIIVHSCFASCFPRTHLPQPIQHPATPLQGAAALHHGSSGAVVPGLRFGDRFGDRFGYELHEWQWGKTQLYSHGRYVFAYRYVYRPSWLGSKRRPKLYKNLQ